MGTMTNEGEDGSTMTQEMLLGLLVISKKNLNPYLAVFASQKKIKLATMRKMTKNWDFGHVECNIRPKTLLNHLCFLAYLFLGSPITFGSLLQAKYKVLDF